MSDVTKCNSNRCPYRSKCWRYNVPGGKFQSCVDFSIGQIKSNGKCESYWPIKK